jgi:putative membrane protein
MFIEYLNSLDQQITLFINSLHTVPTDYIMQFFSMIKIWFPMYLIIVGIMFWKLGWKRGIIALTTLVVMVVFCDQFANLIKNSVCRLRPLKDAYMLEHGLHVLEDGGGLYGFFSGHAANAFGFAVSSYMLLRQDRSRRWKGYAWWIFSWATMVSISRIFVGKHFFGDVLVGAIVGAIIGYSLTRLAIYTMEKVVHYIRHKYRKN